MIIDAHADILTDISNQRKKSMENVFNKRHLQNFRKGKITAGIFVIGIDHLAFGFDFCEYLDEYENTNIKNVEDSSRVQDIISAMKNRGYSQEDIEKISYKNFKRVINKILCE